MGMTFSNIHLKKNSKCNEINLKKYFIEKMDLVGYNEVSEFKEADYIFLINTTKESDWISIDSNYFDMDSVENAQELLQTLSSKFKTDCIAVSCINSDFMMLNWINSEEDFDAWINIEKPYGGRYIRKTDFFIWKKKIKKIFAFWNNIIKSHIANAEGAWYTICDLINIDKEKSIFDSRYYIEYPDREENRKLNAIYFRMKNYGGM